MRRLSLLTLLVLAAFEFTFVRTPLTAAEPPLASSNLALLQSEGWQQLMHEFDEWASVQKLYERSQTDKYRAKLIEKASTLPADQLQEFVEDLAEKLEILSSAEARSARQWLTQTLNVASDSYAKKVKARYPDIAGMSASQIQARLDEYEGDRASARKANTEFEQTRQFQVKGVEEERKREDQANAQARASAGSSGYHPGGFSGSGGRHYGYGGTGYGASRYRSAYGGAYGGNWGGFRW